jgi:hypothetical protein
MAPATSKRVTVSAKTEPQRSTTDELLPSEIAIHPLTREEEEENLLFAELYFSPNTTRELCELLKSGNDESTLFWIRKELALTLPDQSAPGFQFTRRLSSFNPSQDTPTSPDFPYEDMMSRDTIFASYFLDAVNFAYSHLLFNNHQIAIWASTFLTSHLSYVNKLQNELDSTASHASKVVECFKIFRENLYRHCYKTSTTPPFIQHQVKSMVDYFFNNYIQHINLISIVFSNCQSRVVYSRNYSMIKPFACTPLQEGILEEKWDDHVRELKEAEEALVEANRLAQETTELEAKQKDDEKTDEFEIQPDLDSCTYFSYPLLADSNVQLLAPFPEGISSFKPPSTSDLFSEPNDATSKVLDKASIQSILDSVTPYFSDLTQSVESRLGNQTSEMTTRIDMLKTVLSDRESVKRSVVSASKKAKK